MKKRRLLLSLFAVCVSIAFIGSVTSCKKPVESSTMTESSEPVKSTDPVGSSDVTVTYKVTFNTNGAGAIAQQTINKGEKATKPTDPTKSGFDFAGWYIVVNGANVDYKFTEAVNSDITVLAKWTAVVPNVYTVQFNTNGGSTIADVSKNDGEVVAKPEDPTKNGYALVDWYSDEGLTTKYEFTSKVTNNITLYAKWDTVDYTITYNVPEGISTDDYVKTYTIESDEIVLPEVVKAGYTFTWKKGEDTVTSIPAGSTGDVEVTAVGAAVDYTITYTSVPSGTDTSAFVKTYNVETESFDLPVIDKLGYTFKWVDSAGNTVTSIEKGTTGNITLKVVHTIINYQINYLGLEDGTLPSTAKTTYAVNTATYILPSPTRVGYVFTGWIDGEENPILRIMRGTTGDISVTATWVEAVNVSFDGGEGASEVAEQNVPINGYAAEPQAFKPDHRLIGWYKEATFENLFDFETEIVTVPIILYAKWEPVSYESIVGNNNFEYKNEFSEDAAQLDNWANWGAAQGVFQSAKDGAVSDKNYVKVENGVAELIDTSDINTQLVVDYGKTYTSGIVEGWAEFKTMGQGNSWTFIQFNGSSAAKENSEVFGLRVEGGVIKARINAGATIVPANNVIVMDNSVFKLYYRFNLNTGTVAIEINGKGIVAGLKTDIVSLVGLKFVTSDSGSKRFSAIDNIAVMHDKISSETGLKRFIDTYKIKSAAYFTGLNIATNYPAEAIEAMEAAQVTILANIAAATTTDVAHGAYRAGIETLKEFKSLADLALDELKASEIAALSELYPSSNYKYSNEKYIEVMHSATAAINAATTEETVTEAVEAAKIALGALKLDPVVLEETKELFKNELVESYPAELYNKNKTAYEAAIETAFEKFDAAVDMATLKTEKTRAYDEIQAIANDATWLVNYKSNKVAELVLYRATDIAALESTYNEIFNQINELISTASNNILDSNTNEELVNQLFAEAQQDIDAAIETTNTPVADVKSGAIADLNAYHVEAIKDFDGTKDKELLDALKGIVEVAANIITALSETDKDAPTSKATALATLAQAEADIDLAIAKYTNSNDITEYAEASKVDYSVTPELHEKILEEIDRLLADVLANIVAAADIDSVIDLVNNGKTGMDLACQAYNLDFEKDGLYERIDEYLETINTDYYYSDAETKIVEVLMAEADYIESITDIADITEALYEEIIARIEAGNAEAWALEVAHLEHYVVTPSQDAKVIKTIAGPGKTGNYLGTEPGDFLTIVSGNQPKYNKDLIYFGSSSLSVVASFETKAKGATLQIISTGGSADRTLTISGVASTGGAAGVTEITGEDKNVTVTPRDTAKGVSLTEAETGVTGGIVNAEYKRAVLTLEPGTHTMTSVGEVKVLYLILTDGEKTEEVTEAVIGVNATIADTAVVGTPITDLVSDIEFKVASGNVIANPLSYGIKVTNANDKEVNELDVAGEYTVTVFYGTQEFNKYNSYSEKITVTGAKVGTYDELIAALANPDTGYILLTADIVTENEIALSHAVTINGAGHSIKASDNVSLNNYEVLNNEAAVIEVVLMNLVVDANSKGRVIVYKAGTLVLDGVTIQNGLIHDSYIAGLYMTGKSNLVLNDATFINNTMTGKFVDHATYGFANDLWIGSEAKGVINGGTIGTIYSNSNDYSIENPPLIVNGGTIGEIFLDYYSPYPATLDFKGGTINKLHQATESGDVAGFTTIENPEYKFYMFVPEVQPVE